MKKTIRLRAVCRHKEMKRERDGWEGLSQAGGVMKVQWAAWVIKRHAGYSEQVLTMCTQCEGCEITHTESLPLPHTHCWTKHRSGRLCVSVILYVRVCVCVTLMSGNAWRSEIEEVENSSISMGSLIYLPSLPPCFYSETHTDRLCLTGTKSHTNTHTICIGLKRLLPVRKYEFSLNKHQPNLNNRV